MSPKLRSLSLLMLTLAPSRTVAMTVTLAPSVAPPMAVGTVITWSASVPDASDGTLWYRYRVREFGADFHVIRDYGPQSDLNWTTIEHEGVYEIEVAVLNHDTGEIAATAVTYQIAPQAMDQPAMSSTANPLLFIYSAPPCADGGRMRVQFQATDGSLQSSTPYKPCRSDLSMNFYIAGLRANTSYTARHILDTGSQFVTGPDIPFSTNDSGAPPALLSATVVQPPDGSVPSGVLLASSFVVPAATDLNGNLIWYAANDISFVTSVERAGRFWGIIENSALDESQQVIRKFDLSGLTLLETNAARVNDQLIAMGRHPISAFHHDVKTLPDGRIVALATVEQILSDVQGQGPVDILGDMIIVFDSELNVVWTWDTFDNLDVTRRAVLGEVCNSGGGSCPPYYQAASANDWTHGNSVQQTPDGNLLYSSRHQDWVIKIFYNNGEGDGHVVWRLGKDGDFTFNSSDAYPWFSHQHDPNFLATDPSTMMVFDNGNTRIRANGGNSRGQAIRIDEQNRTANLVLNADLGVFSLALGSAQQLSNGNYSFDAGYVLDADSPTGSSAYAIEVNPSGNTIYKIKTNAIVYRWFRLTDIYSPN